MAEHIDVMISSTARDLPEHRQGVLDACLRQGMHPIMMEHLPASDKDAITVSLKMVDDAEIYLGIFAFRYGYVPKGYDISVTEMEYNRAAERGIPRLIFVMHDDHPIKRTDVETGEAETKLKAFKERLQTDQVINFFKSPDDLRVHVINSLSQFRQRDLTAFHYISDIPEPPEVYIAHPYTLLQTGTLIGRQPELNTLTDWVANPTAAIYDARVLNVVAIGGMGKSALTWKWFNDVASQEMKPLAGRMWWSFYESDANFENFIIRALAYTSGTPREEIQKIPAAERESQLLALLDQKPFLLVLDGLERILIAYARMDAARLADDDLDERTDNRVTDSASAPENGDDSFTGQHRLRKTSDPRAGNFLRKLANVRSSRILVSTRLYPADLQMVTGKPIPGSYALFLPGLTDDDALNLWRSFDVSGSREALLPMFNSFGNYPLLIRALAGEVAGYRRTPGDFDKWQAANPHFSPFKLDMKQAKSHVLEFALQGLDDAAGKVLHTVAAFRMPATYDTLADLLIGDGKPFSTEGQLDDKLTDLEDRGLLGWDKRANRYDLHPIVRGVAWSGLDDGTKSAVYSTMYAYFDALRPLDQDAVTNIEELTYTIELYNTLIGLKRYDDACDLYYDHLRRAIQNRFGASRQRAELLEMLFPDGIDKMPRLSNPDAQAWAINSLAIASQLIGEIQRAIALYRFLNITIYEPQGKLQDVSANLYNLAGALRSCGMLYESEVAARQALIITRQLNDHKRQAINLAQLGKTLSVCGQLDLAELAQRRAMRIAREVGQPEEAITANLAQLVLLRGDAKGAYELAKFAEELTVKWQGTEYDLIASKRLQGFAALETKELAKAEEHLSQALIRARNAAYVSEELRLLCALASLRQQQGDLHAARELLNDVWEPAERGPERLDHANALNVLAQIERDSGNQDAAIRAATEAYRKAWCDGPPFAYHTALEEARNQLKALGAPEPTLMPFDPAMFNPMPEVEIDPQDQFHEK
jgi:tetratricopeptide (TPR) repeat protein